MYKRQRPDTFRVPSVGLNTISNTLIEAPSPYAWQRVKPFSHPARVYGTWDPRFGAPSTPMHPPYAVCLFVLYKLRYRLYIFTGYRRILPRYPILARAKNGVFCNVTAPAPPRMGKTVGRRILLGPDMARRTRPCSGKRRNLTRNARQGYPKATIGDVESYADNSNCRILQKMHGAPHGTHCRMVGNRPTASSRRIPEEITFELAIGYGKQKGPRA